MAIANKKNLAALYQKKSDLEANDLKEEFNAQQEHVFTLQHKADQISAEQDAAMSSLRQAMSGEGLLDPSAMSRMQSFIQDRKQAHAEQIDLVNQAKSELTQARQKLEQKVAEAKGLEKVVDRYAQQERQEKSLADAKAIDDLYLISRAHKKSL